ncbi:AraC family transcriptional regulator [Trinickia caryophylli]|uniref:AraC-type DNA-binding protein n=1 Tax=Trinickia caryophylli TaxID=28094 RepID=A0A1X7DXG7_TRICW|nr:AraC family transcriptional regulator [Trinickia caryophylli]PMS14213.1 AraC family transcriptional regulator [Trinickia caryophylli]TRX17911.1 helix-turn-helix transcriptional regulator [Trinickia caryophylli]WQE11318.1 AraC family transcriptional regulator [Trinickia caryophylli]SMF23189.1 AraC-type DNA-binding protein [Trinickia caryophylli]GLU32470.1 AraC family transcriptional regulator [Trinickia caryophylli]
MAKIAVALDAALARQRAGELPPDVRPRRLAAGTGWSVEDVLCTHGPNDEPFEERHDRFVIALVAAGAFEYRSSAGPALMTPGSLLLGNAGAVFECRHDHRTGDRCIAFRFARECFEQIAADAGMGGTEARLRASRVAPSRTFARHAAAACAGVVRGTAYGWDTLAFSLADRVLSHLAGKAAVHPDALDARALERVMQVVSRIDEAPDGVLDLDSLARHAGLSPYHFVRTFRRATGTTPHQYVLRARLRAAAARLADEPAKIVDIALDCGFDDLSNFNRAFRAEFGANPRAYRARFAG